MSNPLPFNAQSVSRGAVGVPSSIVLLFHLFASSFFIISPANNRTLFFSGVYGMGEPLSGESAVQETHPGSASGRDRRRRPRGGHRGSQ